MPADAQFRCLAPFVSRTRENAPNGCQSTRARDGFRRPSRAPLSSRAPPGVEDGIFDRPLRRGAAECVFLTELVDRAADRGAVPVAVEHPRVDVRGPADRGRVAEVVRDFLDRPRDRPLPRARSRGSATRDAERDRGEHRRVPRPEVLRREVPARVLLDVRVDVRRLDVRVAAAVLVGEELVAARPAPLQVADQLVDVAVDDGLDDAGGLPSPRSRR